MKSLPEVGTDTGLDHCWRLGASRHQFNGAYARACTKKRKQPVSRGSLFLDNRGRLAFRKLFAGGKWKPCPSWLRTRTRAVAGDWARASASSMVHMRVLAPKKANSPSAAAAVLSARAYQISTRKRREIACGEPRMSITRK